MEHHLTDAMSTEAAERPSEGVCVCVCVCVVGWGGGVGGDGVCLRGSCAP